jgi:hypothetical protein
MRASLQFSDTAFVNAAQDVCSQGRQSFGRGPGYGHEESMTHNDTERLITPTQLADTLPLPALGLDVIDAVLEGGHRIVGIAGADFLQHRDLGDEMCVPIRAARVIVAR